MIEFLLTLGTPRKDCKPAAKAALKRFKSLQGVFEASNEELCRIEGIGPKNVLGIKLIKAVAQRYLEKKLLGKETIHNSKELMNYLNKFRKVGKLKTDVVTQEDSAAYHSPCHLCALKETGASVELLSGLVGIKIEDISAGCCGLAGTCGMQKKNFELSNEIGKELIDTIKGMDADYVVTECSACRMQIEQMTDKKVFHPIKVLAKAYRL